MIKKLGSALLLCWLTPQINVLAQNGQNIEKQEKNKLVKTISGIIVDEKDEPAIGVSVAEIGTQNGTVTDEEGHFKLKVNESAKLTVSYLGYKSQVIHADKDVLRIVLETNSELLDEVVVTALGIKREEKALGYSVQKVDGATLQTVKGIDVGTSLTGKVAGLKVLNSTEFGDAPIIEIRGETPLVVIDGVPHGNMSMRDVPSDDIEDISVLKGATASALYGSRAASGAIMITTKKGADGNGLSISVNSGTMFTAGYLAIPKTQSTFGRVVDPKTNTYARSGDGSWGAPMEGQEVIQWDPISKSMQAMPYLPRGKDNFKNFLEQGYILNNNVSVVQQGKYGSFRTSATWVQNKGQYPNSEFDKYTFSIGGDMKLNKLTLSSTMTYNKQTSPNLGFNGYTAYDPMYNLLVWSTPDYDVRDYKDYWLVQNESQNNSYTNVNNNPYFDRYERTHSLNRDILNGMLSLNYDINSWLKGTARVGFDTYSDAQNITISQGSLQSAGVATITKNGTAVWGDIGKGQFDKGIGRGYSLNSDFILSAEKKINDFSLDGFLGGAIYYRQDEAIEARTEGGLSIPGFYSLKASVNPISVNSSLYQQQVNSLYGRLGVSWKGIVYAEGTFRNDWSSTLSKAERSYLYPAVSTSFIISELLPKTDWLSLWKLRGSWTSAKTPANIYEINQTYDITQKAWGDYSSASYPTTIRQTSLHPESSSTFEIGTAASFFKNRASIDLAYYDKRMYDFLKEVPLSPSTGYKSNYVNTGEEISRKGLELTARIIPIKNKDWKWDISFNWSTYARYYTKLDDEFTPDKPWIKEGERVDALVIKDYQRDPNGNIIYSNGVPTYSAYDSKYGNYDPDYIWGLASNLKYKNWQLAISLDGRVGGLQETTTEMYMWRAGSHPNSTTPERYLDATQPGTTNYIGEGVKVTSGSVSYDTYGNITNDTRQYAPNDVPVTYKDHTLAMHKGTAWGGEPSSIDVYSATFFKIREISLTYNLPKTVSKKLKAKNVSLSLVGQNILLWAKDFKYSDPDGGVENFSDPSQRYLGFNIKLDF